MKSLTHHARFLAGSVALALCIFAGCGKQAGSDNPVLDAPPPKTPVQAAKQLEQAFVAAPPQVQTAVTTATEGMRTGDYEKAVAGLEVLKATANQTMEQGMAVHNSSVALEQKLIAGIQAGDPNAKRAYELLKKMKKN